MPASFLIELVLTECKDENCLQVWPRRRSASSQATPRGQASLPGTAAVLASPTQAKQFACSSPPKKQKRSFER